MNVTSVGVIGLGVMGKNLALNLLDKGFNISVYNRQISGEDQYLNQFMECVQGSKKVSGFNSIPEFASSLQRPRIIIVLVKAGSAVTEVINSLKPCLENGDVIIDGGNSHYADTENRVEYFKNNGIDFVGMGVSGGKVGARNGPSLMPGGNKSSWELIRPILESIAAKTDDSRPCCAWIGNGGAGHFSKMVHNGIEYADMQIISEAYHFMRSGLGMNVNEISDIFCEWNTGLYASYLLEITAHILATRDNDQAPMIDKILDVAEQKGTGLWVVMAALKMGMPLPVISEAVNSRLTSGMKSIRETASHQYRKEILIPSVDRNKTIDHLKDAMIASRIMVLAEAFSLIDATASEYKWSTEISSLTEIWQNGCIIRSTLLKVIKRAIPDTSTFRHLLLASEIQEIINQSVEGWRTTISTSTLIGIPVPAIGAALFNFDSLRTGKLPANLIQAQRDFFGAHGYERVGEPRGIMYQTNWDD